MNDQNNPNSEQPDLNSLLSSHPQAPTDPSLASNSVTEDTTIDTTIGGGLMSPPISAAPPPTDSPSPISLAPSLSEPATTPQTASPFGTPPPPVSNQPPPVDVPQFSASPFTPPLTTQSDPSIPQNTPASAGSSGFGTILESSSPAEANAAPPSGMPPLTEKPQNFNWPSSPVSEPQNPAESSSPTVISPDTDVHSSFTPADLSNVQNPQPTPNPISSIPMSPLGAVQTENPPGSQLENPPTDLSHLIEPNGEQPSLTLGGGATPASYNPPAQQPESLVIPTNSANTATAQVATAKEGVPKWVIILGVVLLLAVAAASAYFILGIGRSGGEPPASAPATSDQQQIVPPPAATATPIATSSAQPVATGSAGFNNVNQSATSAADLLRQRQGR